MTSDIIGWAVFAALVLFGTLFWGAYFLVVLVAIASFVGLITWGAHRRLEP